MAGAALVGIHDPEGLLPIVAHAAPAPGVHVAVDLGGPPAQHGERPGMAAGAAIPGKRHVGLVAEDGSAIGANDKAIDDVCGQAHHRGGRAGGVTGAPGGTSNGRWTDELCDQQAGPHWP